MTFISYAQNFEDVMLWRALKHIDNGFYMDIGAWSPDIDSVTRAFYERGWSGINVEPNPEFNSQLQERRSRDQNLRVAVGDCEGSLTMNFLGNPGLSTLDDSIASQHQQAGWSVDRQEVHVTTLAALWGQYVPAGQDVHFLKVDVEGFEEAVLRGNDWAKFRPWVVVVEATLPMSQVESHDAWEPLLLAAGYTFGFADGLNRFYVAKEQADLLPAFKYPANVFDDFVLNNLQQAEGRAQHAEARAQQATEQAQRANEQALQFKSQAQQAEVKALQADLQSQQSQQRLLAITQSRSWRIAAPLRWCGLQARTLRAAYRQISGQGGPMPAVVSLTDMPNEPDKLPKLSPIANAIYAELEGVMDKKRKTP